MERVTTGTGMFREINLDQVSLDRRLEQLDRPGAHLWVYVGVWATSTPREPEAHLDSENLVGLNGPGCYKCEQPYSNRLARRPCRGRI